MSRLSRRRFVAACVSVPAALVAGRALVTAAGQGLGQFSEGPAPCKTDEKPTPAAAEGPDFKPKSPERTSLVEPGVTGTKLVLTGTVSGITCGPIKRAQIDFWQTDAQGLFDKTGFRLRGHQFTGPTGSYRLETILPGPENKGAPRLHVKVQPPAKAPFTTQLFFAGQPLNQKDPQFNKDLVLALTSAGGGKAAVFNIVLNL
jgi:protocatechuate 3,4-dioxygenase beta subunit